MKKSGMLNEYTIGSSKVSHPISELICSRQCPNITLNIATPFAQSTHFNLGFAWIVLLFCTLISPYRLNLFISVYHAQRQK